MSIIVSRDGKNAKKLARAAIQQEDYLQRYIYDNPDCLPLEELKENLRLLVLAREFSTASGPIDALGVDGDGDIYILETKLYKNPDKRVVLAQVLDYGASLWRSYEDAEKFVATLDETVRQHFKMGLTEKLAEFFGGRDESVVDLLHNLRRNQSEGNYCFIVLMDRMDDRLKDLITFINQRSGFRVFGVELDFYKHDDNEIIVPSLYGAEVKKEGAGTTSGGVRRKWDEQSFFEAARNCLAGDGEANLRKLYKFSVENAASVSWGTGAKYGSFNPRFTQVPPRSLYTVYSDGTFDLNFHWPDDTESCKQTIDKLKERLEKVAGLKFPPDYRSKCIRFEYEQWAQEADGLIRAIAEALDLPRH
jgi:hypothetical protein